MLSVFLLAFLGSIIPTVVYVSIAWWLDRYEKEPWRLLVCTFLWGAVPAIILAAISESAAMLPLLIHESGGEVRSTDSDQSDHQMPLTVITAAIVAPIVEEILKAIPLVFIFVVFRHEFDGLMDGLLYGAIVGFGFAMTENFFYIYGAGSTAGLAAGSAVFVLRTIVFGMMHALWSSMLGIGLGIARYTHSRMVAIVAPFAGLLIGMLLHSIHNLSAVSAEQATDSAILFVMIMFASYSLGCFAWLVLVFLAGRGEAAWIRAELAEEVDAELLTPAQAEACGRYRSRVIARWQALQEHGFGRAHQLGRLYSVGAALAFKKRQLSIHSNERNAEHIEQLRNEISQLRTEGRLN